MSERSETNRRIEASIRDLVSRQPTGTIYTTKQIVYMIQQLHPRAYVKVKQISKILNGIEYLEMGKQIYLGSVPPGISVYDREWMVLGDCNGQ